MILQATAKKKGVPQLDNSKLKCKKKDCFACRYGRCTRLNSTDFGGYDCPFYKTDDQIIAEKRSTEGRLTRIYGEQASVLFAHIG